MVRARRCDKYGIDVDTDDVVTELGEVPAMPSWAAPGVEKSCSSWCKSSHQTCLPVEVLAASGHLPEAVGVAPRVRFVGEARPGATDMRFRLGVSLVGAHAVPRARCWICEITAVFASASAFMSVQSLPTSSRFVHS